MIRAVVIACVVVALGGVARADQFDPEGWRVIGKKSIKTNKPARISLGDRVPSDELTLIVTGADVVIDEVVVTVHNPRGAKKLLRFDDEHSFDKENPAWTIPLGQTASIWRVDIHVKSASNRRARVQVLARDSAVQVSKRKRGMFSAGPGKGWTKLASERLDGERARATIKVTDPAPVSKLTLTASGADLAVANLVVKFDDQTEWSWVERISLDDQAREHTYLLQDPPRAIETITFLYGISSGTFVNVDAYGVTGATDELPAETFDDAGWTLLAEDEVDVLDQELEVDRSDATWSKVAIVGVGDDVHLNTLDLQLAGKADKLQRIELDTNLTEASRSRIIEITGKRRAIEKVQLRYRKHRLDASTRVRVYAR